MNISLLSMQKAHKQNVKPNVKKKEKEKFQFLRTEKQQQNNHTKISTRDGVLRLSLFQ